jgi:predicted  nucleic acid-binding Zn-ribbon protein
LIIFASKLKIFVYLTKIMAKTTKKEVTAADKVKEAADIATAKADAKTKAAAVKDAAEARTENISDIKDTFRKIDEKYDKAQSERMSVKDKVARDAGTASRTRIAGLRGLEPRWGTQFTKDRNKFLKY